MSFFQNLLETSRARIKEISGQANRYMPTPSPQFPQGFASPPMSSIFATPDYAAYVDANPDLAATFSTISTHPKIKGAYNSKVSIPVTYDKNLNQRIDKAEYGQFHFETAGFSESGREVPRGLPSFMQGLF